MGDALEIYKRNDVDLIICEYFRNIVEIEWAIEVALEFNLPVAATMCMGPCGDENGVSVGECAVRMARAGAQIVGTNCLFDPFSILDVMRDMKEALKLFNLSPYLMAQPNGYRCPDGGTFGWCQIPEFPFAVEPRQITRWEARKWAREAYNIRAMAEELLDVRGKLPVASAKSDYDLSLHKELEKIMPRYKGKGDISYWMENHPCTGRPLSTAMHRQLEPVTLHKSIL